MIVPSVIHLYLVLLVVASGYWLSSIQAEIKQVQLSIL